MKVKYILEKIKPNLSQIIYFFFFAVISPYIFISGCFINKESSIKEVIIPEIKIAENILNEKYDDYDKIISFKPSDKIDIFMDDTVRLRQDIRRYMKVNGNIRHKQNTSGFFKSVIFELMNMERKTREYYFIPVDYNNRYTGYLYFRYPGEYKVYAYLFMDYRSEHMNDLGIAPEINTTASLGFFAYVIEPVPEDLCYLLPTKNIDCGNVELRDFTAELVKDLKTNEAKAKKIYEFLVFGDSKHNFTYKKYKSFYVTCSDIDYHNAYIASQIFLKKRGVCNDFAEVYAAMMRSLGFKVKKVWGFTDETKSVGHMWNLVDLIGDEKRWLRVDPTWGNGDRKNFTKWAEFYPDFDENYFNTGFRPYNHRAFDYELKIEY